ncbi:DNA ligase 1 isoform X2 [Teleopsis dalmanni]|uniref:DNA ligase 1 isoform X2 n=1 Tax=Teleopsis dalmanni TaxID=139649 RepID=UPI0018CE5F60|nr:DNA ligase 1 isoform X2 [Teleopsis dalmanni]XP_037956990.1 DNA ligase 1 isoform X2 [Teleopsis dalmanni]XP_037956991.1 DNA ligase 1 isoform X2 [Teleopsis dalmanni]XP_037956992.1 DNA ligase 1 isoform X2 [Teleopsis dalmanni]XP_037956993.1 DNA ligase 1 isoform X2 [Teleopsis dalmanni]
MKSTFCWLSLLIWLANGSWAQRSPYSLQAAVDELHHREAAKYPLNAPPTQQHFFGSAMGSASEQDYWDEDIDSPANTYNKNRNRHRVNNLLAKYLERENYDADHGGLSLGPFGGYEFDEDNNNFPNYPEETKRSSYFRERDNKYDSGPVSVFRERDAQVSNGPEHAELTEQFLREIEETQEHEREERYKEALRHLWEKYQQQENDIEGDLFEEKKRIRTPPYYMLMQKKRSYPVLPWLPYSEQKKRFPVAKRSTKRSLPNEEAQFGKTDEKVAQELSELFGTSDDEKKKRSINQENKVSTTNIPNTSAPNDMHLEIPMRKNNLTEESARVVPQATAVSSQHSHQHGHAGYHGHTHTEHKHKKRSHSPDSHEEPEDSEEHDDEHEEEEEEEEHEDFEEEEEEERKKKRDLTAMKKKRTVGEVLQQRQTLPDNLTNLRKKKSIQWSKYFGLDRKKKAVKRENKLEINDDELNAEEKKKRDLDIDKLDNMDRKLQSIEDFIIDETIKYTGAHEGIANPEEIRRLKDHVLSRLATAYSLEKMRRALEKLRQSVDNENHLLRNVIDPEKRNEDIENQIDNEKRLSIKKEKAPEIENPHGSLSDEKIKELNSIVMMNGNKAHGRNVVDDMDGDMEEMRKKKKRNGYLRYPELPNGINGFDVGMGGARYESLNDAYLGNKNYIFGSNQCPLIESMAERCRGVDLLSGDINQELLPICGVHQICYLCVSKIFVMEVKVM